MTKKKEPKLEYQHMTFEHPTDERSPIKIVLGPLPILFQDLFPSVKKSLKDNGVEECRVVGVSNPQSWIVDILKQIKSWSRKEDESPVSLNGTLMIGFLVGQACVMHQHSKLKLDAEFIEDFNNTVNRQIHTNEEMQEIISNSNRRQMYLHHDGFYSEAPAWMV